MSEKRVIGLVGCGRWGRFILRDLVGLGAHVIVAARSEDTRRRAVEGGATGVVGSVGALPRVDGVVVATPSSTHALVVEVLLDRGVPVFVEKPLTVDRASAARLAQRAPDRLFVMDKWRYHPGIEMLAEIARSGELGPVLGVRTTRVGWGNRHPDVDGIWTLAPHDLAIGLEILGTLPQPRSAIAERVGGTPTGLVGILGDDPWLVTEVSTRYREHRREIRLHCRDGVAVVLDAYDDHVQVTRGSALHDTSPAPAELRPISRELPLLRELHAFLKHLNGGPSPRSSAEEGAAIVGALADLRALAGLDQPAAGP